MKIKITNFLLDSVDDFPEAAEKIERLEQEGFKPYMCLTQDENYSVWAFIKE